MPMLVRLAVWLSEASPTLRRWLWRWWYGKLAQRDQGKDWTFMNYGLLPGNESGSRLELEDGDEPDRLCIQLYDRVASAVPSFSLEGLEVLEVGSGRGGGASFVARYHRPARITGADFSPQAVALCKRRHGAVENLQFTVGDAEHLPFPDASFDAVLNVESSHCYGDLGRFFSEVLRVLRPGGYFLYTDFRPLDEVPAWHAALAAVTGFERVTHADITREVADAMEADDQRKRQLIRERVPPAVQHLFGEFAGLVGGQMYQGFRAGTIRYELFGLRKSL